VKLVAPTRGPKEKGMEAKELRPLLFSGDHRSGSKRQGSGLMMNDERLAAVVLGR
jgi:hypothetical protein